ncbi:ATP-binding protein [Thiocapsa marina]|uniref:histidine kinase n=1 Tax=Thiocapsa marina 5811 TaxID=768671 RepID=F9U938_9GAMM|nr:ATP-binding protein [Thiocapsa marina]EGV19296.1 integral membrane sensor signal transduction histidine kinase [Thiocapsa marina 5811]
MSFSIHTKVFLTLLLACVLVLSGTQAFVHWSLQRGLVELAEAREQARVEVIGERLIEIYAGEESWAPLRASPRLWLGALLGRDWPEQGRRGLPGEGSRAPPWARRFIGTHDQADGGDGFDWPPPSTVRGERRDQGAPIELRLMLLDAEGALIYGRPELLSNTRRFVLDLDGRSIGELAVIAGPPVAELADLHFVERQGGRLWLIVAAMLAVAAALAYPLSSRLIRPVKAFQQTARRLAAGDYDARVAIGGGDEIARLGRDINALADALGRNDRARRQWVADISHELRTPLALLRAHLEAMQDGVRPLERGEIDRLHGDVLRLSRLVEDLNDLARTDLGALAYHMQEIDLAEILREDIDAFRTRFEAAGLDLAFDNRLAGRHDADPAVCAPLRADAGRISQLFGNLLHNSLSYTDSGGGLTVTLDAAPLGGYRITFEDTAPGVPTEDLPRLFDRLYRVDASRSRHTGGAGLGLAIAKNVVSAHGGSIEAHAAAAGGCAIRIELPASPGRGFK